VPINIPHRAVYAVCILAIEDQRVNSVEDSNANQRSTKNLSFSSNHREIERYAHVSFTESIF